MNPNLKFRFCRNLVSFVILIVLSVISISGCNLPMASRGTKPPQVSIQNAIAGRDPATGVPFVIVDYTVQYPSDLYAQTLPNIPTLTCRISQTQLTRESSFIGTPANIIGTTAAPQTGEITISGDKSIAGEFFVECTLNSDHKLATSNRLSVDVPTMVFEPLAPTDEVQSVACEWQVTGTWNVTQTNNYHPVFEITQTGVTLTGTATLSESEATAGGYTGTTGTGSGSVTGNEFVFLVEWPRRTDGKIITGAYTGKVTEGEIDGRDNGWYGIGPSRRCTNP